MTLGYIGPGGLPANNFSNTDRSFVTEIVPQLGNDAAANKIKLEASRRLVQLDQEKAKEWLSFRRANKGKSFDDFEVSWNDKLANKNIFGDLLQKVQGAQPGPQMQGGQPPIAGARRARDGNWYVKKDGQTYRVDQ